MAAKAMPTLWRQPCEPAVAHSCRGVLLRYGGGVDCYGGTATAQLAAAAQDGEREPADATELGTSGLGAFPVGSLVGGIYLYPIFMEAPKPVEPTPTTPVEPTPTTPAEPTPTTPVEPTPTTPVEPTPTTPVEPTPTTPVEPTPTTPVEPTPTTPVVTPTTPVTPETTPTNTPTEETNTPDNTPTNTPDVTKSNTPADNSSKIIPQTGVSSSNSNSVAGLAIVLVAALGGAAAYLFTNRKKLN